MEAGKVIAGRWRIEGRAPARGGVERWRAVAVDTGAPVELLRLRGPVGDPTARGTFLDVHRPLVEAREPALIDTHELVQEGRATWVVRAPLEDATLADVRGPLDAGRVAAIGAALVPAVLAAGGASLGALRPEDVGIDATGQPVVAPLGAPLTAVARGTTRAVAPEAFGGERPDGRAGLYGLGALLYQLATGQVPASTGTSTKRAPPPPPSTLRPGLPGELDAAIMALMSADPSERPGALPLLQGARTELGDLRSLVRAPTHGGEVKYTVSGARARARARAPDPTGAVVLRPSTFSELDASALSHAAGLAGVSMSTVDALADEGLPLVLSTHVSASATRARGRELSTAAGLPVTPVTHGAIPPWLVWGLTAATVTGLLGLGTALFVLLGVVLGVGAFGIAALVAVVGGWLGVRASGARADHAAMTEAHRRQQAARERQAVDGRFDTAWRRIAELRVQLATLDLPEAAATDLRGAIREIERRLEGLARVVRTTEQTLDKVDATALRTRLKALSTRAASDAKAREERDRLARTVADLDAVQARREAVERELAEVHDALSEVAGVFGQLADPGEASDGLARLTDTTRMVREAVADALPGESEDGAEGDARRERGQAAERARRGRAE